MPERHVFSQASKIMPLNDVDILWQEVFIVVCPLFGTMGFSHCMASRGPWILSCLRAGHFIAMAVFEFTFQDDRPDLAD